LKAQQISSLKNHIAKTGLSFGTV